MCRANPSAAAKTMRSVRTALQVAFSVRAGAGEAWSTNFDIYLVAADGGAPRNLTADNPGVGRTAGLLARRHAARLRGHGPAGFRGGSISSGAAGFEIRRQAPAHPELGPVDRELCLGARRQDACLPRPITWASARCGPSMSRPAGPRRSPAPAKSRASASAARRCSTALSNLAPRRSVRGGLHRRQGPRTAHPHEPGAAGAAQARRLRAVQLPGWNNENVFGYVVKPPDFKRDQKYPVAFLVHGGPQGSFGECLELALERRRPLPVPATAWS
jgi:hypothetical protein